MSIFAMNFYSNVRKFVFTNNSVIISKLTNFRPISTGSGLFCEEKTEPEDVKESRPVQTYPVETSIKYIKSAAYFKTYGDQPVWVPYRRNFAGGIPPRKTRLTCIRGGFYSAGNLCPICRDEYLVLHYKNTDLLKQFISPNTGEILGYRTTNICQKKHHELLVAIEKAKDCGTLTFDIPIRFYNYSDYIKE